MAYRCVFKLGDRVSTGNHIGDVEETKLMVTYLRTPKNEVVAMPNSVIIHSEVVNYSTLAKKEGLILHAAVGIGYEKPWRQVEAILIRATVSTVHANSAAQGIARLTTCVLQSGIEMPYRAIKTNVADTLNIVIQIERRPGSRFVSEVLEIGGYSPEMDSYDLQPVYLR